MMARSGSPEITAIQCWKLFSNELAKWQVQLFQQVQLNFNLPL
jgi:hypothetical protein